MGLTYKTWLNNKNHFYKSLKFCTNGVKVYLTVTWVFSLHTNNTGSLSLNAKKIDDCYTLSYKKKSPSPSLSNCELMTARLKRTKNVQQISNLSHCDSSQIIKTVTRIHKTPSHKGSSPHLWKLMATASYNFKLLIFYSNKQTQRLFFYCHKRQRKAQIYT